MNPHFCKPMECLSAQKLPIGEQWTYEIKLDGFRTVAVRTDHVVLYSRQGKLLTSQFMQIASELEKLPPETVIDGEVVALDKNGVPRFNLLQNYRSGSAHESGRRSGSWVKLRFNCRQQFVIGGYTPSHLGLDALLVGVYKGKNLHFARAVRGGFTPVLRREVHEQIKHLETAVCPFVSLPDRRPGSFGQGLTREKMSVCTWLRPTRIAEIEFAEWTPDERLRHAVFMGMRSDKKANEVIRET